MGLRLALAGALLLAGCGSAEVKVEDFRQPAWKPSHHPLGRGKFDPANVSYGPGGLSLRLPAGSLDGGEVQAPRRYGDGTFSARMRSASSPGSISAFFLYQHDMATDSSDELDFEIPGGGPHRVLLTVWNRGKKTPVDQREAPLPFDPAAGLHDYAFEKDGASVKFKVDGKELFSSSKAPRSEMRPIFNAWYPTWQEPAQPPAPGVMTVDRFELRE